MKKINELESMSTDELTEKRKKLKMTVLPIGVIMGAAFIFLFYTAIKTKNYSFTSIAIGASLALLPGIKQLKEIDNELKRRDQSPSIK